MVLLVLLVFTTTGGMADECLRYLSRLAELLSAKKQESYTTTISWVRAKVSFAILRSALLCLRGSRTCITVLLDFIICGRVWTLVKPVKLRDCQTWRSLDCCQPRSRAQDTHITVTPEKGPVSRQSRKFFGPAKPFLISMYLKTERCSRLKLLV